MLGHVDHTRLTFIFLSWSSDHLSMVMERTKEICTPKPVGQITANVIKPLVVTLTSVDAGTLETDKGAIAHTCPLWRRRVAVDTYWRVSLGFETRSASSHLFWPTAMRASSSFF
jgi:hypothetical protein